MLAPACPALDEVRRQVEQGGALLFQARRAGTCICAFVLRIDELAAGPQGVIVAAAGDGGDVNLTDTLLPAMEGMFSGCTSVRIHTRRRGLAKKLMERGYAFEEIVLTREL